MRIRKSRILSTLIMLLCMIALMSVTVLAESYDIWVGGVQVTSDNASDIASGNSNVTGTVTYNDSTKTLTLNGATITSAASASYAYYDIIGIYTDNNFGDLTIELTGVNHITGEDATGSIVSSYGIHVRRGNLTFTGSGSLDVSAGNTNDGLTSWSTAVYAYRNITVNGCSITAKCGDNANHAYAIRPDLGRLVLNGTKVPQASTDTIGSTFVTYNSYDLSTYKLIIIEPIAPETVDGVEYTYTVTNGKATITDVNLGSETTVSIPSQLGGYDVAAIGNNAFKDCTNLISVTIPNSVIRIEDGNESIGGAFDKCRNLQTVTFAEGSTIKTIGFGAFGDCDSLTTITIPNSVETIGGGAFGACNTLSTVEFQSPSSVKTIDACAFSGCFSLSDINIPASVETIGAYAFAECRKLTSITIPASVTSIGESAFELCGTDASVTSFTVDFENNSNLQTIGEQAFAECSKLTSITIPASVTSIGALAFHHSNLSTITFETVARSNISLAQSAFGEVNFPLTIKYPEGWGDFSGGVDNWPSAGPHYIYERSSSSTSGGSHSGSHGGVQGEAVWSGTNSLTNDMAAGNYYLTGDMTLTSEWKPENDIILCLNGHTLTLEKSITADSGRSLKITNCNGTGKVVRNSSLDSMFIVEQNGALDLYGLTIDANNRPGTQLGAICTCRGSFDKHNCEEVLYDNSGSSPSGTTHQGICSVGADALYYNTDDDKMISGLCITYGDAAYYALFDINDNYITDHRMVEGLKIKVKYTEGEDLIDGEPQLVKVCVNGEYRYFIKFNVKQSLDAKLRDVCGTLTLNKSKKGDVKGKDYRVKDLTQDFDFEVGAEYNYVDYEQQLKIVDDPKMPIWPNEFFILKYDCDDEVEFEFGSDPNEGSFTVDVSGQGKNLITFNTEVDANIEKANPDAKMIAISFNNVRFNRTGVFNYEADDMKFAYEIKNGVLAKIADFTNGEVEFKTNTLGRYIFSDVELVSPETIGEAVFVRER